MWFVYYGYRIGMTRAETECTKYGEMLDLLACHQIYNGTAVVVDNSMTFDEFMSLR